MRRPRLSPMPEPKPGVFVGLPPHALHTDVIDAVCQQPCPEWTDLPARRRWLLAEAELQDSPAAKLRAVQRACERIGFRFA